ncbi:MAG TPA: alpha/beta hydrolase [Candidatus Eisenbacteria bacterium]|nr:alpha/beta hydrolase [Candidatus Eisenbacteria bacterium]
MKRTGREHRGPLPELDLRYEETGRFASHDGVELYFELHGDGPLITFLNHSFLVGPAWRSVTDRLAERHRLLFYDLRNQGASSRCAEAFRWEDHVADLAALLDHVGAERSYVLGTSSSTLLARDFALAHPERVSGLLLVGPAFSPYGGRRRRMNSRAWLATVRRDGTRGFFESLFPLVLSDYTQEQGGQSMFLGLREAFLAVHSPQQIEWNLEAELTTDDDPAKLRRLACPTLFMIGDGDFLWSQSALEEAARLVPRASVHVIPRAGHLPYFEASDEFQAVCAEFVDRCERERVPAVEHGRDTTKDNGGNP